MLNRHQQGSIIGLLISAVFIFILVSMIYKTQTDDDNQKNSDPDHSLIEQTQDSVNNANEAGKKANTILKGLTGQ